MRKYDPETLTGVKRAFGNNIYDSDMRMIYKQASIVSSTRISGQKTPHSVDESTEQSDLSAITYVTNLNILSRTTTIKKYVKRIFFRNVINYYKISREKLEPEPGFEPRTSGFLARRSAT